MNCHIRKLKGNRLQLTGELCILDIAEVSKHLLAELTPGVRRELDLSRITAVDTAGIQLLLLLSREAVSIDSELVLLNFSEAVQSVVNLLALVQDQNGLALSPKRGGMEVEHEL